MVVKNTSFTWLISQSLAPEPEVQFQIWRIVIGCKSYFLQLCIYNFLLYIISFLLKTALKFKNPGGTAYDFYDFFMFKVNLIENRKR